jgi:uncharacterized protein (DUF924 family)
MVAARTGLDNSQRPGETEPVQQAEEILSHWFAGDPSVARSFWFSGDPDTDRQIRERFADDHVRLLRSALDGPASGAELAQWAGSARGRLALILVLDQFSRHLHRGDAAAFAGDRHALALTQDGIATGLDRQLAPFERYFFYMPLMHAEDLAAQEQGVAAFRALRDEAPVSQREVLELALDYARRHRDVIARFGRFPHRNAALGRSTTAEEAAFLQHHPTGF